MRSLDERAPCLPSPPCHATSDAGAAGSDHPPDKPDHKPTDNPAHAALWTELYPALKRMARARLRRSSPHTLLDPTGLVNDVYLRVAGAASFRNESPGEFLAYSSRTMRSIVIDLARERQSTRRGGGATHITLDAEAMDAIAAEQGPIEVDQALQQLSALEPRLGQVAEMRYFGGFTEAEIGTALGITERTVRRDWEKARLLLRAMLADA